MKSLGIVLFIVGLLLVPQFVAPVHSSDTGSLARFGFVVVSKQGFIAGIVLMVAGVLIVRRALRKNRQPCRQE